MFKGIKPKIYYVKLKKEKEEVRRSYLYLFFLLRPGNPIWREFIDYPHLSIYERKFGELLIIILYLWISYQISDLGEITDSCRRNS